MNAQETVKKSIELKASAQDLAQTIIELTQDLLITDASGVYIPQIACENFDINFSRCWDSSKDVCLQGPNHERYWDCWQDILECGTIEGKNLYQNGDLWLVDYNLRADLIEVCEDAGLEVESEIESFLFY